MKYHACEPCLVRPGRLSLTARPPKGFFDCKNKMALLGALSGSIAYLVASQAHTEQVAVMNRRVICSKENDKRDQDLLERPILEDPDLYDIFRSGNSQHLIHSAALLAVPYAASQPAVTTGLLLAGMLLFCGSQYKRAFDREPDSCETPLLLGTVCLLGAWISFLL